MKNSGFFVWKVFPDGVKIVISPKEVFLWQDF
jgi:hypothetical protein